MITQPPGQAIRFSSEQETPFFRRNGQQDRWKRSAGQTGSGTDEILAAALGWFSIAIGLAEIIAPHVISRLIGVRGDHRVLLRVFGLREIASGLGILSQRNPAGWLWSRVAGDGSGRQKSPPINQMITCRGVPFLLQTAPLAVLNRIVFLAPILTLLVAVLSRRHRTALGREGRHG